MATVKFTNGDLTSISGSGHARGVFISASSLLRHKQSKMHNNVHVRVEIMLSIPVKVT